MIEYLSTQEVARMLGLSPARVRQLVESGRLRFTAICRDGATPSMKLFLETDVEVYRKWRAETPVRHGPRPRGES